MHRFFRLALLSLTVILITTGSALASGGTCSNFAAGSCPANVPSGVTSFYFIDYATGSDSNSGTSETSPWQHMPTCNNATGSAAAHTPGSGEGWILKGGVTVDYHCWPANLPWGGANGAPDYMGPDPGWFTGASWTRPIFSGGGINLNADSIGGVLLTDSTHHASHLVLDNIEFTGFYWSSSNHCYVQSGTCGYVSTYMGLSVPGSPDVAWEFKNIYGHNITHASGVQDQAPYGLFWMPRDPASSWHDGVIDNTDGSYDCCGAVFTANIYNAYFSGLDNVIYNPSDPTQQETGLLIHDFTIVNMVNTFQTTGNPPHGNCIHLFGSNPSTFSEIVYNGYVDCKAADAESFETEEDYATVYAFNLVFTNMAQPNGFDTSAFTSLGGTYHFFNITEACGLEPNPQYPCFHLRNSPTVYEYNMLAVGTNNPGPSIYPAAPYPNGGFNGTFTPAPVAATTCAGVATTNFGGTLICAPIGSGNGTGNLNFSETYPYAPLDSTAAARVGTASSTTVRSLCTTISGINAAAGTACLSDTSLGVSYNTSNHSTTFPARTPLPHPTSGNWQIGAYEGPNGSIAAPTGLTAVVQ